MLGHAPLHCRKKYAGDSPPELLEVAFSCCALEPEVCVCGVHRHRHRHRHTDTQTHRHTDTQTHTDTHTHTHTHTQPQTNFYFVCVVSSIAPLPFNMDRVAQASQRLRQSCISSTLRSAVTS